MIGRLEFESGFFAVSICRNSEIIAEIGIAFLDPDGFEADFRPFSAKPLYSSMGVVSSVSSIASDALDAAASN